MIDAVQWNGNNYGEISYTFPECFAGNLIENDDTLLIKTLEGNMTACIGDYIIKGIKGEFYPCRADIFELTYERVDE